MDIISLVLTALALAADAMSVSITNGIAVKKLQLPKVLLMALLFGGFQALMPTLGWLLGTSVSKYISAFDHWIAFLLLAFIGFKMIVESFKNDEETVKKLITAFEGQSMKYETYFKLVLATGLRRGEACGLKWSDINWRKRTIHVQRGVVKLSHQESITKDPKTSSGDRMVYLSKEMCQLLKAWRKECEWDRAQTANETVDEDDYLFRQPNGKPMNPCTFTYRFKFL